ncbi:MAG: alpha/beta fold hydrolase [Candidatus Nanopelagicales bacterium]|nr:alpha/beta fold hydrolase [Candidatus Nanopelagicales bacterium]MDP4714840.1 alpha/beta fold hydrolase [Candidatus Nanopelagicales bacterium]MDP4906725.1 alpha/beta fold hydrolase [Candidatus Nanopelagicales bacterium]MDP4975232.1 alpha/beta fold hydrolase [Candidatus Nanopelagicales bacterium]
MPAVSLPTSTLARIGAEAAKTRRTLLSAATVKGVAIEAAWVTAHVAMYPLGIVEEQVRIQQERHSLEGLPPTQRGLLVGDIVAAGTPIVLVHGIFDNRSIFTLLRRGLHRRGFGSTYALNYSPWTDDIRSMAARLGDLVAQVCDETGHEQVHVIGHSMGGLIGRYLVQRMGGDDLVHTLVTLGTPHSGTLPAHVVPLELARQMRIGGALINELAEPAPGCRTRMLVIWSDIDQLVIPQAHGRLDHPDLKARNVLIRGVGHLSLPVDGRVIREIGTTLALLDDADPSPHTSNTM